LRDAVVQDQGRGDGSPMLAGEPWRVRGAALGVRRWAGRPQKPLKL